VRRIGRYILIGLTALSLLLCVVTVALWLRSYYFYDGLRLGSSERTGLESVNGKVSLRVRLDNNPPRAFTGSRTSHHAIPDKSPLRTFDMSEPAPHRFLGFAVWTIEMDVETYAAPVRQRFFVVPYPALLLAFSVLPIARSASRARRRRRSLKGLCARCGYDLRATPDRCPECGTIPTKVNT
jgi:hypothetical protein